MRLLLFFLCLSPFGLIAQSIDDSILQLESELSTIEERKVELYKKMEGLKLKRVQRDLQKMALPKLEPNEEVINHSCLSLVYSEKHEQAKWVAHIIIPDVTKGSVIRTNDFREDPKVKTNSAVEKDYFLKIENDDGSIAYDGFGYDRGHLAPSADFRWSQQALSESYFYSNMSPQLAEFNRGKWAELEHLIRGYLYNNPETQVFVVTGPVLEDDLPVIERSINKVSIPKLYFKVAVDLENKKAIGFLMPNEKIDYPIESFAVSIDKVEEETGIDFFPNLPDDVENSLEVQKDIRPWFSEKEKGDVTPLHAPSLPPYTFNTIQAKKYMNSPKKIKVCGTVVSSKRTRKGNMFLNLDKKFPNQVFSVFIRKEHLVNFSYDLTEELNGKQICLTGLIKDFNGVPTMSIEGENQIRFYKEVDY